MFKKILLVLILLMIIFMIFTLSKKPSHNRNWTTDVEFLTKISARSSSEFEVRNLRDWTYDKNGPVSETWTTSSYDIDNLQDIWFYKQPFGAWSGIAHTFLVFEFKTESSHDFIGVSVEARKEIGETYSGINGLFNNFELVYQWVSEKDLLTRRTVYLGDDIHQYKLELTDGEKEFILRRIIATTQQIDLEPRFYNTLKHNCTNELAQSINMNEPFPFIPRDKSFVFTGFSNDYLQKIGYIKENNPIETNITQSILSGAELSPLEFSKHIRK